MPNTTPTVDGGQVATSITTDVSGAQTLHVQKLDASGAAVGPEFEALQSAPFLPVETAALSNGGYAVLYGYAFRGWTYEVSVFDAAGAAQRTFTLPGFGQGAAIAASPEGGFLVADRSSVQTASGVDYSGPPLITLYDNAGAAAGPTAQLTGELPTITVLADGHYQLAWADGNLSHTLDYDPKSPPDFAKPAAPQVQVIDDVGAQQHVVAAGQPTNDPTPTLRVAIAQPGFVEIVFGQGAHDDPKVLGGIQVTAADIARGYVDVPEAAPAAGPYDAYIHFKSLTGVAGDATHASFIEQPVPTPAGPAPSGQVTTGAGGGASASNDPRGGEGNDAILGGTGFNDIGDDRPGDIFHTFFGAGAGAGLDVVAGFDAAGSGHRELDVGAHDLLSPSGADRIIDMGGGDEMILKNAQLFAAPAGWLIAA